MASSYDTWEYANFPHILQLRSIFARRYGKLYSKWGDSARTDSERIEYLSSPKFILSLGTLLYKGSDKKIYFPITELNNLENAIYTEYLVKRN